MKKNVVAIITILSILLSPLCGGLVGRLIAELDLLGFPNTTLDSILCYFGIIAWIIASLIFYHHYTHYPDIDSVGD